MKLVIALVLVCCLALQESQAILVGRRSAALLRQAELRGPGNATVASSAAANREEEQSDENWAEMLQVLRSGQEGRLFRPWLFACARADPGHWPACTLNAGFETPPCPCLGQLFRNATCNLGTACRESGWCGRCLAGSGPPDHATWRSCSGEPSLEHYLATSYLALKILPMVYPKDASSACLGPWPQPEHMCTSPQGSQQRLCPTLQGQPHAGPPILHQEEAQVHGC